MNYTFPTWTAFRRIFDNRYDTYWWLGEAYYKEHGQKWPFEGQTPPEGYVYPTGDGIKLAVLLAILLTLVRFAFERLIAEPIGRWCGLKHKLSGTPAGPNAKLEEMISKKKKPTSDDLAAAAKDAGMELRDVEIWVRRKQRELMPSKLNKFKESLWRFLFYTVAFSYGLAVLWKEEFFWKTILCWVGFPTGVWAIKKSLYYYYLLEGSFYLSLMVSQFMDTKRKDFWEMFVHHVATLFLIGGSYFGGCYRVGALVMITHDVSDIFLEVSKLGVYLQKYWVSAFGFGFFTITWIIFRLILLPYRVIYSAIVEGSEHVVDWPVHLFYSAFLILLQILHLYWFTFIIKVLVKIAAGDDDVEKDNRSDVTPASSETEKKKE